MGFVDITEILLKVALNTTKQTNKQTNKRKFEDIKLGKPEPGN
jgi:hypothetical protein